MGAGGSTLHRGANVSGRLQVKPSRREFLCTSMLGGGGLLTGFDKINGLVGFQRDEKDAFRGGKQLGVVECTGEGRAPLEQGGGSALGARMDAQLAVRPRAHRVPLIDALYVCPT